MLALSNLSIRKQILLGFFPVLLILAVIAAVSYQSFRSFSETFDELSTITNETQLFLQIDEDMTELQRNVLVYSYVGYNGILSKIERLQQELEEKLEAVRPITKNNSEILDRYTRLIGHYKDYKEAFAEAVLKRSQLSTYKKETWQALSNEGYAILELLRGVLEQQNDYHGRYLNSRLEAGLAHIDDNKRAFEASPDVELVKDTHRLLNEMQGDAITLKALLNNAAHTAKIDRFLALLPEYRESFMTVINLKRVYLHLTNVVLAGKAAEIDKLSKELNKLAIDHASLLKQEIDGNIYSSQRDSLVLALVAAFIGLGSAWLIARNIAKPVGAMAETLLELAQSKKDIEIPGLARRDEVGQMAKAASAFKEMSLQLADNRSRLAATLENMNDGLITINQQGLIESFNVACEYIFGYSSDEMIGKNIKVLMPEPYHSQHDDYLKHYAQTGEKKIIGIGREVQAQRKDGTTFPIELSVAEFEIGSERKFSGVIRDITERKQMDTMKDEFISTVNHELRTPLTSIQTSLGLLRADLEGTLDDDGRRVLDLAYSNCERLSQLVNDILDIEKIAAGKMEYSIESVEMVQLVQDVIDHNQGYASKHSVQFDFHSSFEEVYCKVDSNRFTQALVNLLSNAAKFSPEGGTVTVSLEGKGKRKFQLSVSDSGPGIPKDFQSKIFTKFAQADSSSTRAKGGTGLGLNITKSIIEAFGGEVSFDSKEGVGTTFHFILPMTQLSGTKEA